MRPPVGSCDDTVFSDISLFDRPSVEPILKTPAPLAAFPVMLFVFTIVDSRVMIELASPYIPAPFASSPVIEFPVMVPLFTVNMVQVAAYMPAPTPPPDRELLLIVVLEIVTLELAAQYTPAPDPSLEVLLPVTMQSEIFTESDA